MALVLPHGETRLYHDKFNLSGTPALLRHFRAAPAGRLLVRIYSVLEWALI
jgi:hypothetical protein